MATGRHLAGWIAGALGLAVAVAGAWLVLRNVGPSTDEAAILRALERETGLVLSFEKSTFNASAGSWRAEHIELRNARGSDPVLRAQSASVQLDAERFMHGQIRVQRLTLETAELTIDLREASSKRSSTRTLDLQRLHDQLPAHVEAHAARLHVRTQDDRGFVIDNIDLTLMPDATGMRGLLRSAQAGTHLFAEPADAARKPLAFMLDTSVQWTRGHVALSDLRLKLGATALAGAAHLDQTQGFDVALTNHAVDIGELTLLTFVAPTLSTALVGHGQVDLHASPNDLSMTLDLRDAKLQGHPLSRLQGKISREDAGFVARALSIEHGSGKELERWTASTLALGPNLGQLRPLGVMKVENFDLRPVLGVPGRASGELHLEATGTKPCGSELSLRAQLEVRTVAIAQDLFDGKLDARGCWIDNKLRALSIDSLELASKLSHWVAHGKISDAGGLDLAGQGTTLWKGLHLAGTGTLRGTLTTPEITAHVVPESQNKPSRSTSSARADVVLLLSDNPSITGSFVLENQVLHTGASTTQPNAGAHGNISAHLEIKSGRLADLSSFEGAGEVTALSLGYGPSTLTSAAFPIALHAGRIELSDVTLADQDHSFSLKGSVGLDRHLDLEATTELALAPLLANTPYIGSVLGTLLVDVQVGGTLDAASLTGRADLRGVEIAIASLPKRWRKLQGHVSLEQDTLHFHEISGVLGTGTLTLNGTIALDGLQARAIDLALTPRQISLQPQERFALTFDADLALRWSKQDELPTVSGVVSLSRFLYARHVQLPEAVIAMGRTARSPQAPAFALDLRVEQTAPLIVHNDFLDVELQIDSKQSLRLIGTDTQLGARGELDVTHGHAMFRNSVLTIRHGRIAFQSDTRIAPTLDLRADAPATRRPSALVVFEASGDANRFGLKLQCLPKDGGSAPAPFECNYEGDALSCGKLTDLSVVWGCDK